MWKYMAAIDGYVKANTPEDKQGLSGKEKDELWEMVLEHGG
jgi:hypothetical protein